VRVVCVGHEVDELLADPGNERWASVSTEFCGGTHLARTGQAVAFAIVSEEGVAKGVRRVTALTGVAAAAAIASAKNLRGELMALHDKAEAMSLGDLEAAVQAQGALIDEMTLPASDKASLRDRLGVIQDVAKAKRKGMVKELAAQAVGQARKIAEDAKAAGDRVVVASLEVGGDRGAMQAAMKVMQDVCPEAAVMLLSVEHDGSKAAVMAGVPKGLIAAGLKAGDWVRETVTVMGGKGGGRPDSAQGGGPEVGKVHDAIARARAYAGERLG
jgi:alanyl-tRNA synthetase